LYSQVVYLHQQVAVLYHGLLIFVNNKEFFGVHWSVIQRNGSKTTAPHSEEMGEWNALAQETQRALSERGWSLRAAERRSGVNYSTIYNMKLGRNVDAEHLIRFATALGEDPNRWLEAAGKPYRVPRTGQASGGGVLVTPMEGTLRLPVVGRIAAGSPVLAEQNIEEFVTVPQRWIPRGSEPNCYALTVRGSSMVGADIHDGDVLAVRMAETAEDGQVVVARIGEDVTVKRLRYRSDPDGRAPNPFLVSDPEEYMSPIPVGADAAIIGLPVGYLRQKPPSWG
jgi:SOS-response transcriptional repressor LexA